MSKRRLTIPKVKGPAKGMERAWYVCKKCKRKSYHDYVPYSMGGRFVYALCGHSFEHDYEQFEPRKR